MKEQEMDAVTATSGSGPAYLFAFVEAMTKAVGGKVGAITSVKSGPIQVTTPDSTMTSDMGMYDTSSIKKTVTATVTVTFKTE